MVPLMKTGTRASSFLINSTKDLVSFVNSNGICYLFKKADCPRIWDVVMETESTIRRAKILRWSESAHLRKKLFLLVDEEGSPLALSSEKFRELRGLMAHLRLSDDEKRIMEALTRPRSTPELRKLVDLPKKRFDKALVGVRSKLRVALVDVIKESKTKHINCYDRIERWREEEP